jgi:hypothetical protein
MSNHESPRQLSLLPNSQAPLQFRLDAATRRRGLRHIAEIRQQMAERQAERASVTELAQRRPVHPTHTHAA